MNNTYIVTYYFNDGTVRQYTIIAAGLQEATHVVIEKLKNLGYATTDVKGYRLLLEGSVVP